MDIQSLSVIIPTVRGQKALPTIESALKQEGFSRVEVLVCGKSSLDRDFRQVCEVRFGNQVKVLSCPEKEKVLPGEARNIGLDYLQKQKEPTGFVLFLDDDIVAPAEYAAILRRFLEETTACAAMGRVQSMPVNCWSRIIDYSNFWWLRMEQDVPDLGWLGTGATLLAWESIGTIRFREDVAVNEDVLFFAEVAQSAKGTLGVCSRIECEHHHNRSSFCGLVSYQFNNGYYGVNFHQSHYRLGAALRRWYSFTKTAVMRNRGYVRKRPWLAVGIMASFFMFEAGIFWRFFKRTKQ